MANLGGNSTVATSMAVLNAAASSNGVPVWRYLAGNLPVRMPLPEIQIFGGGAHAGRRTDIQDFLVMPVGAHSFDEALSMCGAVYRAAGELLKTKRGRLCGVADEGGWWPAFDSNEDALASLATSIERAGYRHGEVMISLDLAASEFGRGGRYRLASSKISSTIRPAGSGSFRPGSSAIPSCRSRIRWRRTIPRGCVSSRPRWAGESR